MYTSEVISKGGEIATSGYSVHPLGLDGELEPIGYFTPWRNRNLMRQSFDFALGLIGSQYPNYQIGVYVIPQSRIGLNTFKAFSDIAPGISTVVNRYDVTYPDQYLNDFMYGENGLYVYTIASENGRALWCGRNSMLSLGVASNSFDVNALLMSEDIDYALFKKDMEEAYAFIDRYDPNRFTVSEAAAYLKKYQAARYAYTQDGDELHLTVDGFFKGMAFLIRSDRVIESDDCRVFFDGTNYVIYPDSSDCILRFGQVNE
jgi:hypothetical protein